MADLEDDVPESSKTPVTIITGFLGSGKTTLVNYILKEQKQWKICIIENEFGEVAIDNDLVEENVAAKEDIITMDNGCVCCSIRGDLVRTLNTLNLRRKDFDAIIIETTGLADPGPIVFTFNSNATILDNYRIDSIVCLVDAKHVSIHLDEVKPEGNVNEAEHQIAFADRILLNKVDLVSEDELEDIVDRIKSINSFASIIKTHKAKTELDKLLGLNSFSLDKVVEIDPTVMDEDDEEEELTGHVHSEHCCHHEDLGHIHDSHCSHNQEGHIHSEQDHCFHNNPDHNHDPATCSHFEEGHIHKEVCHHSDPDHHHSDACLHDNSDEHNHEEHSHRKHHTSDESNDHSHNHEHSAPKKKKKTHNLSLISSVGFTIDGLLDVAKFNTLMTTLLQTKAADLYRTKGVLAFSDQDDAKFVFQGVHEQINFGPSDKPYGPDEPRVSKMVFIGKNLDYEALKAGLLDAATDPSTAKITMHKR